MISRKSTFGTLAPFTAIASPLPAEVRNARRPEVVDTSRTLTGLAGLVPVDPHVSFGRFARLPRVGIADYWGKAAGYASVWDCIEETQRLGICRRVANVFDVPLPCPVLMLHAEAVVDEGDRIQIAEWLYEHGVGWSTYAFEERVATFEDQPWREANSLGRKDDDDFLWHPYVALWRIVLQLKTRRLFGQFREECSVRFEEGIFGISWLTDFVMVLQDDQDEVPDHLAAKGVIPALAEDDPRAKEVGHDEAS